MADSSKKAYEEALKALDLMIKKQENLKKSAETIQGSWGSIASEIFKMDGAQFFKNVAKTDGDLKIIGKEISNLTESVEKMGEEFSKAFEADEKIKNVSKQLTDIGNISKISSNKISSQIKTNFDTIKNGLDSEMKAMLKNEKDLFEILKNKDKLTEKQKNKLKSIQEFQDLENMFQIETEKYSKRMDSFLENEIQNNKTLATFLPQDIKGVMEKLALTKDLNEATKDFGTKEKLILSALAENNIELAKMANGIHNGVDEIDRLRKEALETKKVFDLWGGATAGFSQIIRKGWIEAINEFDKVLNNVQKQTSINMDDNKIAFAELQTQVAQYGVSIEQAGEMMTAMSNELQTTNFSVLAGAAKDFAAIEGATGAAASDISTIGGELMRMGENSEQVKDFMQGADQMARNFGISSKKALTDIAKNITKMRTMGFVGGEDSLKRMVVTANRLKMNVDEIFDVADKARSIEGAMDMAAELQLAGGSFANINPMDLLAAARKGPEELQKILTGMGKDVGHWVTDMKGNKKYEFDPIDVDRLNIMAKATGQSLDSVQKMIQSNASDMEKFNMFQGVIDGVDDVDKELVKSGLSQMLKMGKDGKIELDASSDMAQRMGIKDLQQLQSMSGADLKTKMEADSKTLEEENLRNQSLKQSFDNFISALMSVFSFFQPLIQVLTWFMQGFTKIVTGFLGFFNESGPFGQFGVVIKWALAGLLLFGTSFGASVSMLVKDGFMKFGSSVKEMMNPKNSVFGMLKDKLFGGNVTEKAGEFKPRSYGMNKMKGAIPDSKAPIPDTKGGIGGLSEEIKNAGESGSKIDMSGVMKFAAAMALIGVAVAAFGFGIKEMGGIGMLEILGKGAIAIGLLAGTVLLISQLGSEINLEGILALSLGMGLIGLAMIPFAYAAQMMTGIDWLSVLAGLGVMTLVLIGLGVLGLLAESVGLLIIAGAVILAVAGAALMVAGEGLLMTAQGFSALSSIDWSGFSKMGDALMSVVPGMVGFSIAAMGFANPLALLGIMFMVGALSSLESVMTPLSESLSVGADSLDKFANGLERLGAAAEKLSLDKLQQLKELSESLSKASPGANAVAEAINSGTNNKKGGDGDTRKIEISFKMNGRDIAHTINSDTSILK